MGKIWLYICLSFIVITIQGCSTYTAVPPTASPTSLSTTDYPTQSSVQVTATSNPSSTIVVISQTKIATELPSGCSEFNLTPEECANLGSNSYSYVETAFEPCNQTDTGTTTFTISFVNNGVIINSPENSSTTPDIKILPNNYGGIYKTDTGTVYATDTVFTLEGFTSTYTRVSGSGCNTSSTYTLIK